MEFIQEVEGLKALGTDVHWFCPRSTATDNEVFYEEDLPSHCGPQSAEEQRLRLAKLHRANSRREQALSAAKILSFDGSTAAPYQKDYKNLLAIQLKRCDTCVREFHRSRDWLRDHLEQDYSAEDVNTFLGTWDGMNNERIIAGLDLMMEALIKLRPEERTLQAAGDQAMYALFEAINCKPFLNNEDLLAKKFDKPFELVQTRRKLLLGSFAPGMAAFLLSGNSTRYAWAERNVKRLKRPLFRGEFENCLLPFLQPAVPRVNIVSLELEFLPIFWRGVRMMVTLMDEPLVKELHAMEMNLFRTGLEHFQVNSEHFPDLIATYRLALEKTKEDFWSAMGTVSPQSVVDAIVRSPSLEHLLTTKAEREHGQQGYITEQMAWVEPFIGSIPPKNLVTPLRTILNVLLHKYQGARYLTIASTVAWEKGLWCLLEGFSTITQHVDGGPVYAHLVEAVSKDHIADILRDLEDIEKKEEVQISRAQHLGLQVIENVLAMDVKSLTRDRRVIRKTRDLDYEIGVSSHNIWKMTMRHVKPGHPSFVMAILSGIAGILPLEILPPMTVKAAPKPAENWNSALNQVLSYLDVELLQKFDHFTPEQLFDLLSDPSAMKGIVSLLFNPSGESKIHDYALNALKILSGEDNRRGSLMHMVKVFFSTALQAVCHSLRLVSDAQAFAPCSMMLKLCRDFLDCLTDDTDGVLRRRSISPETDKPALRSFWHRTWTALKVIFEMTESWSSLGHDKTTMMDFCRETMDFADYAFDQYSIIAGTLETENDQNTSLGVSKTLLQTPSAAFTSIIKWLRLRDEYLISKAVELTTKMLGRFQEAGIKINSEASQYIADVVKTTDKHAKIKTKLTRNHKAELQRALEQNIGSPLSMSDDNTVQKKQGILDNWTLSSSGQQSRSGSSTPGALSKAKNIIDLESWSTAAERKRAQDAKPMQKVPSLAQQRAATKQKEEQNMFLQKRKQAIADQEQQRRAAVAKANLGAGSGVAGIGNLGKDHSTAGQTVMVDDDELDADDDDDDDDFDDDLFGTSEKPKKAQRPQLDVSGTTGLKPEVKSGPTRIQRTARTMKDMRARLKPDLGPLYRTILAWDYFHEGDFPPGSKPEQFSGVLNSFTDPNSYQETFEPLLILEAWQGMVKERGENSSKPYEIKVSGRSTVDQFIEINGILGHQENREHSIAEGDIILLSTAQKPAADRKASHCLARVSRMKRSKNHIEVVYQLLPTSPITPHLGMQAIVYGLKLQTITPLEREYGALKSLQYYDLCNQIVRAKPSPRISFSDRQVDAVRDAYNLNKAQAEAVNAALENEGFSLIQGPPGTGKTKTITAIVGGLLTSTLSSSHVRTRKISVPMAKGHANGADDAPPRKLMVCAPSNAAVDEIVLRLRNGVKTKTGDLRQINVVRIGRGEAVNQQVRDVTMEQLVEKKMGGNGNDNDAKQRASNAEAFQSHSEISQNLNALRGQRDAHDRGETPMEPKERQDLEDTIRSLQRRKAELGTRIDNIKDQQRNAGREQEVNLKKARQAVLDEAHVICATLSGSGHDMFSSLNIEFETIIIDEAAQCVEMSSLIPLKYGCVKCIMVGDPKQLPPTVFSRDAARFQYEQSLFVRMQNNFPNDVHLLDTQYRMHPHISLFPARSFYDCLLNDGPAMAALRKQPWHKNALLAPYRFFDVQGHHKSAPSGQSLVNEAEIKVAFALFDRLMADFKTNYDFSKAIGIITPYKAQLKELRIQFKKRYGEGIDDVIEFNTTDAFQGRECEIIIFSCVRASPAGGIGFLQDIRRMNVGLTRAKSSLWVLGNSASLSKGEYWKKLVEDARARDRYTTGDLDGMLRQPSSAFPATEEDTTTSMLDLQEHRVQLEKEEEARKARSDVTMRAASHRRESVQDVEMSDSDLSDLDAGKAQGPNTQVGESNGVSASATLLEARLGDAAGMRGDRPHAVSSSGPGSKGGTAASDVASAGPNGTYATTGRQGGSAIVQQAKSGVKRKPAPNPFMPRKPPPRPR